MSDFNPGDKSTKGSTFASGDVDSTTHQFTGSIYITGTINCAIESGSAAGAGSYVAVDTNDQFVLTSSAGGGGDAGGSDTQIQYNNGGTAFGGISAFTWDDTDLTIADDTKLYFGTGKDASVEYDENDTDRLIISGSAAGINITGSVYIHQTGSGVSCILELAGNGDAHLILNADTENLGEGDNPAIEFRQDGGANKSAIGMIMTDKNPVGGTFTDGLDNAFALTTLIPGIPIQMGVTKTGTGSPEAQFTIEAVSGNVGINEPYPKVSLDVFYDGPELLSDNTGGGHVVSFGTASGDLTAGALYYLNSDGGWASASADATGSGNSQLLGISMGTDPEDEGMLLKGYFDVATYFSGGFIKGGAVYIQSGSEGYMSGAAPDEPNAYARIVGHGTNTPNVIYFDPSPDWVELD